MILGKNYFFQVLFIFVFSFLYLSDPFNNNHKLYIISKKNIQNIIYKLFDFLLFVVVFVSIIDVFNELFILIFFIISQVSVFSGVSTRLTPTLLLSVGAIPCGCPFSSTEVCPFFSIEACPFSST